MVGFSRVLRVLAPLAVVCGALFAVSCGSNNNSVTTATSYPTSAADVVTLSTSAGSIPLPAVSPGNSVTLTYVGSSVALPSPFPSAGITLSTTQLSAPPTNAPAPTSKNRTILSHTNAVNVTSVTFTTNYALPFGAFSGETLNIAPNLPVNQAYFVEIDDLTSGTYINTFPGSAVSAGAVQFTNASGFVPTQTFTTYNTTDTYLMQFYYLASGTPATPTPSPSPNASASPGATPTPVVVSTTVPLGAATNITLPVVAGGFNGSVALPAAPSGASLTISGASTLPAGITTVGTNDFPYYIFGFTATGSTTLGASPGLSLQLPANFSESTSEIFGALCTVAQCPIDSGVAPAAIANGVVTFATGAFPDFTSVGTTTQYVIVYTSRGTPAGQSTSQPVAAGATASIAIPSITTSQAGVIQGTYTGTLNLGGLGGATTVTVAAQTGLFPSITAIVPNTQQIFYALAINASPQVSAPASLCGATGCSAGSLTIPSGLATALTGSQQFYVEECSVTACPVLKSTTGTPYNATLTLSGTTLTIPTTFATDVTTLVPANTSNPAGTIYLVFYYQ
jgi:hypothetical protein